MFNILLTSENGTIGPLMAGVPREISFAPTHGRGKDRDLNSGSIQFEFRPGSPVSPDEYRENALQQASAISSLSIR
jgi:hypothetical protein